MDVRPPLRIVVVYVLVATAWILWSDRAALALFGDAAQLTWVQTVKGLGFVLASGALIGGLVRREQARWRAAERASQAAATRFETLFRSSPAGILIVDLAERRYLDANERLLELFGYDRSDLVGRPVDEVELWADPDDREAASAAVRAQGQVLDASDLFVRADGSVATMIWSAEVVREAEAPWLAVSMVDVSERTRAYEETLEGWARALDLRDDDTAQHSLRVTWATVELGRRMGLDPGELVNVRRGALLHDIGKIGVPDAILHKPGPLTEAEWAVMRRHPVIARDLLAPIAYLRDAMEIPVHHHERWDGSGYPDGLAGEGIPLAARIFAVVDVWDALTSDRPYRGAWSEEAALAHLHENAGRLFDPACVDAFLAMRREGRAPDGPAAQLRR
jgi:PAS domain S-box-containing protein